MELILYKNFKKRKNSTKQPSGGTTVTVNLKEKTSIHNPVFILEWNDDIDTSVNYCKWHSDYYYVTDIAFVNYNHIEISCSMDELASHKSEIGNTTAFIERAALASACNGLIFDKMVLQECEVTRNITEIDLWDSPAAGIPTGSYVIGFIGSNGTQQGGINYLCLTAQQMQQVVNQLLDSTSWVDNYYSPFEFFVSAMYLPFDASTTNTTDFTFGYWDMATYVTDAHTCQLTKNFEYTLTDLPKHPSIGEDDTKHTWLNTSPYTKYTLYMEPFGTIPIEPLPLVDETSLHIHVTVDCITGMATLRITETELDEILATANAMVGVPIQLAQSRGFGSASDITNLVGGAAGTVGMAMSNNWIGAIATGLDTIGNALEATIEHASTSGVQGSRIAYHRRNRASFIADFITPVFPRYTDVGYPVAASKQISSLSGFVKCTNASVSMDGFESDKETINNYLNTGFYYE